MDGLRRKGEELGGYCPLHKERRYNKDAFSINTARNIFHCFACGASGNLLDSSLSNGCVSLWTALVYLGRTVPLLCRVLPRTMTEDSRNAVENAMILELQALFGIGWVLIADRGFARASLLQLLHAQGIDYVIRIDEHTTIHTKSGQGPATSPSDSGSSV